MAWGAFVTAAFQQLRAGPWDKQVGFQVCGDGLVHTIYEVRLTIDYDLGVK